MNKEFSEKDINDCYERTGQHPAYWKGYEDRINEEIYRDSHKKNDVELEK